LLEKGFGACFAIGGYEEEALLWFPFSDNFPAEKGVGAFVDIGGKAAAEEELLEELAADDFVMVDEAVTWELLFNSNARSVFSGVVPNPESASREASVASIFFNC